MKKQMDVMCCYEILIMVVWATFANVLAAEQPSSEAKAITSQIITLDGSDWKIAADPQDKGREEKWFQAAPTEAKPAKVPGVMQDVFPDYHGLAWYWRQFEAPTNLHPSGRYLLRFAAVDYLAEVWLNGIRVGLHEGAEDPFEFDATRAIKPGVINFLAVRVLNPTSRAVDGIRMLEVAQGRRGEGTPQDNSYSTGGIIDSVALCIVPAVRIADVHVVPDWTTGGLRVRTSVFNAGDKPIRGRVQVTVAPAVGGESVVADVCEREFAAGDVLVETHLQVPHHRLWELNDPYLYRVTAGVQSVGSSSMDERSVRCGFRDFRFQNGYFRLNGRRIRPLGSLYTVRHYPGSVSVPYDEDLVRRDVLGLKMMGFNSVRVTCGAALPARQLDIFDEMGLLVMEEHLGADGTSRGMVETPFLEKRWDANMAAVIRRDRNHPCIVMWSLLNEAHDGRLFRNAVKSLQWVRDLDDTRIVMLNSGRFDRDAGIGSWSGPGSRTWEKTELRDVHSYPAFPHTAGTVRGMRGTASLAAPGAALKGGDASPMLLSEYGVCGAQDYPRFLRHYEQLGMENAREAQIYRERLATFMDAWKKCRLDECWARPEDYFRDSHRNMARLVLDDFNAWMANPRLVGAFSSTQIIDAWFHGCGVLNYFRELKPGMADVYTDIGAEVRWHLFVEPVNVYRGTKVKCEAVLVNLDALRPDKYPVRVQVVDQKQKRIFEEVITVDVAKRSPGVEPPFAQLVFSRDVVVDGPGGQYRFLVDFERGAAANGGDIEFFVADKADMPAVRQEIVLWGDDAGLERVLSDCGIAWHRFSDAVPDKRHVILVSGTPPAPGAPRVFAELARRIATGSRVVFLTAETLKEAGTKTEKLRWAPFPEAERPSAGNTENWYFRPDHWVKDHPIFAGLPRGGIMDYRYYREMIDGRVLKGLPASAEAVCGVINTSGGGTEGHSALMTAVNHLGAGMFILNTLHIRENLGSVPAAERLLRNMLNYAGQDLDKPLADLPVDFDKQLETMGYK